MQPLSVLVPTYNCARTIRACLDSVKWASEILVVDSYSTDETVQIAEEYTRRVIQHEYINSAKQKNWAIPQCEHEWVLVLDSDEQLEPELAAEIQALLAGRIDDYDGFRIPRKNLVYGKWLKSVMMYPDYNLRLFRKSVGRYTAKEVHADVCVPGRVGTLQHAFVHEDFTDLCLLLVKWGRYIRYEGDQLVKEKRAWRWYDLVCRPLLVFLYQYFGTAAFRDGFRGLYVAVMHSVYIFLKYARLWEIERYSANPISSPKVLPGLGKNE